MPQTSETGAKNVTRSWKMTVCHAISLLLLLLLTKQKKTEPAEKTQNSAHGCFILYTMLFNRITRILWFMVDHPVRFR
jgi:hypothetical protein